METNQITDLINQVPNELMIGITWLVLTYTTSFAKRLWINPLIALFLFCIIITFTYNYITEGILYNNNTAKLFATSIVIYEFFLKKSKEIQEESIKEKPKRKKIKVETNQ